MTGPQHLYGWARDDHKEHIDDPTDTDRRGGGMVGSASLASGLGGFANPVHYSAGDGMLQRTRRPAGNPAQPASGRSNTPATHAPAITHIHNCE